jgi:hypothetical protein
LHGNAGNVAHRAEKVRPFMDQGYGVLLVGYRGYGGNPGAPSEEGLYHDAEAALAFLAAHNVGPDRQILYGESLGSGVAVEMAQRRAAAGAPVAGVVLEAPYTSMPAAAAHHYPFVPASSLIIDKYDSLAKIEQINAPLYIFHGDQDIIVPQSLGRDLFDAADTPKRAQWIDGAGHNDLYDFGAAEGVMDFLRGLEVLADKI